MIFRRRILGASCAVILLVMAACGSARGDVMDDCDALQGSIDGALLDLHGERWSPEWASTIEAGRTSFAATLSSPEARALWAAPLPDPATMPGAAGYLGELQARLQHVVALEMIACQQRGDLGAAREWRSLIKIPRYASSVEGALALLRMGNDAAHRVEVSRLLAKEDVIWQITRAREKADALSRLVQEGRATPNLIHARAAEIEALSTLPPTLLSLATAGAPVATAPDQSAFRALLAAGPGAAVLPGLFGRWRMALEARYPNLLSPEDVRRRERIVLKLLRLIPKEYMAGVRDGEITVPLEYREAKSFTIQCRQIVGELLPVWRQTRASTLEKYGPGLLSSLDSLEGSIDAKAPPPQVEGAVKRAGDILQDEFGLTLKRAGSGADVVTETSLEVRSLLGQSLAAARAGQWRQAEALRLDAYVNFDLEIEARILPRDPTLALRAERAFLDGEDEKPGIKAALDGRLQGEALVASYQRALDALEECVSLTRVGLSPTAAALGAVIIIAREGLEAVIILAALLAGLRGAENRVLRRRVGYGAWLALAASAVLFLASRSLLQGLSHYGETLEAVISVLAVLILLVVTNWVFHKYYWTGWNSQLRELSKAAQQPGERRFESFAMIGVGFMTIFREGFETTLFMQSLILEAGLRPVLAGVAIGGLLIALLGFAVFSIGARLPYRKMLVFTGALVVFILFTFLGSTTRLFQTVGWLPVHPIHGLHLPAWMGVWLGLYPTWEGVLIPLAAFAYVGGAWLWVKFSARRATAPIPAKPAIPEHAAV